MNVNANLPAAKFYNKTHADIKKLKNTQIITETKKL